MSDHNVFTRRQLSQVAPWIDRELRRSRLRLPASEAHPIFEWVQIVEANHSELWHALDAQG